MSPDTTHGYSRRAALALAGSVTVGLAGCLGDSTTNHGWQRVSSPTKKALRDVVFTSRGPVAAGEGGRVLARTDEDWETVVERGPGNASNGLTGAATTAGGERVWVCGDSGAVGRYDVAEGKITDHSAPKGKTSSWADVAVVGPAGDERVRLLNGSGELLTGRVSGGSVRWGTVTKPSGGDSADAIAARPRASYLCDSTGSVYRRSSNGRWRSVGIDGVSTTLHDVAMLDAETVTVVGDDGSVFVYDGYDWLAVVSAGNALHAVDRRGGRGVAVGPGGTVVAADDTEWTQSETPVSTTLHGVALGTVEYADVAVGVDGTILENFA
ncbi:hypothetical protein [Halococcus hamelinensis]|uniref:hypothetical protein n=1 Tax=Halococcus hamelinensis TaxID=332168 RepID=UPI00029B3A1F|nr:hypothetical protein [Halococcus hamelinensis]